jgi:hypothetical protein
MHRGRIPPECIGFIEQVFEQQFLISVIVKIEVLGFDDIPDKMEAMEDFVGLAHVISLDNAITKRSIALRRKYKS